MDVGIVGAGYAGSALALLLGREGHRVTLYERVPEPGPVGAGILLQPTGMVVLDDLGLLPDVLRRGAPVRKLDIRREKDRRIMLLDYAALGPGWFAVGLHRGALYEVLFSAVKRAPVALQCGVQVSRATPRGSAAGGWRLADPEGRVLGEHELLVVADGSRSQLELARAPSRRSTEYPWGAAWMVLRDPEQRFGSTLHQHVSGTRTMLGFLPTGYGPDSTGNQLPLVSLFWSLSAERVPEWRDRGLAVWRAEVEKLAPKAIELLPQIRELEQLVFTRYADVSMARFNGPQLVYLGDSAHAMSPQLGQGANLALYDAWVLAACLTLRSAQFSLDECLAEYNRRRSAHLDYYQWATRFLTPFFQSDYTPLGPLRDFGMSTLCRVPAFARMMVESMAGIRTGLMPGALLAEQPPELARAWNESVGN